MIQPGMNVAITLEIPGLCCGSVLKLLQGAGQSSLLNEEKAMMKLKMLRLEYI